MIFRSKASENDGAAQPNTIVGVGASFRGTLMVPGTLRIDGEFEGDILNCDRLEIGEHGIMRGIAMRLLSFRGSVLRPRFRGRRPRGGRRRQDQEADGQGRVERGPPGRCRGGPLHQERPPPGPPTRPS